MRGIEQFGLEVLETSLMKEDWAEEIVELIKYLPSMHEGLGSIPRTHLKSNNQTGREDLLVS